MKRNVVLRIEIGQPSVSEIVQNLMDVDLPELHEAVKNGDLKKVCERVTADNVNSTDLHGFTPLHHAAMQGHTQIAEVLITSGATKSLLTNQNFTAYDLAKEYHEEDNELLTLFRPILPNTPKNHNNFVNGL